MKLLTTLILIMLLMFSFTQDQAMAQDGDVRKAGLTASLQSDLMTILVPIWFGDMITVAPGVNLMYTENSGTMLGLLVAPRFYIRMDRVSPYFGGALGVNIDTTAPAAIGNLYDWLARAAFGGEYFVNPMFSFGVEAQLNVNILDSARGASNFTVKTGAAVHANVYF